MDPVPTDQPPAEPSDGSPEARLDAPLEAAVLARLRAGDRTTFHDVVRPLLGSLLSLARRLTGDPHSAEDLVQETLVQGFTAIHTFRGDATLRTWLFRIESRLALRPARWQRGTGSRPPVHLDSLDSLDGHDSPLPDRLADDPEASSRERELAERLDEAMERLTPRQRLALHLRAVEGLDYRHIAEVLGSSPDAARMLVLAARKHVMRRLGRHLEP